MYFQGWKCVCVVTRAPHSLHDPIGDLFISPRRLSSPLSTFPPSLPSRLYGRMQEAFEETRGSVGVTGRSAETGHDFYDALSFMDWQSVYTQMLFDLRCP